MVNSVVIVDVMSEPVKADAGDGTKPTDGTLPVKIVLKRRNKNAKAIANTNEGGFASLIFICILKIIKNPWIF